MPTWSFHSHSFHSTCHSSHIPPPTVPPVKCLNVSNQYSTWAFNLQPTMYSNIHPKWNILINIQCPILYILIFYSSRKFYVMSIQVLLFYNANAMQCLFYSILFKCILQITNAWLILMMTDNWYSFHSDDDIPLPMIPFHDDYDTTHDNVAEMISMQCRVKYIGFYSILFYHSIDHVLFSILFYKYFLINIMLS